LNDPCLMCTSLICPAFIRGLLENVGAGIDPIRLIRRIKNGLEIPGLKPALIKILQDFNLQLSLLDGCKTILDGDCADLAKKFHKDQTSGFFLSGTFVLRFSLPHPFHSRDHSGKTICPICTLPLQQHPQELVLLFLCRHVVHAKCARGGDGLPHQSASTVFEMRIGSGVSMSSVISGKIALCVQRPFSPSADSHVMVFTQCFHGEVEDTGWMPCMSSKRRRSTDLAFTFIISPQSRDPYTPVLLSPMQPTI